MYEESGEAGQPSIKHAQSTVHNDQFSQQSRRQRISAGAPLGTQNARLLLNLKICLLAGVRGEVGPSTVEEKVVTVGSQLKGFSCFREAETKPERLTRMWGHNLTSQCNRSGRGKGCHGDRGKPERGNLYAA